MSLSIDKKVLEKKGITEEIVLEQIEQFKKGFPFLRLYDTANIENKGIKQLSQEEEIKYIDIWEKNKSDKKIVKFVPASGAASRMFKDLFEFLDSSNDSPTTDFEKQFFSNIRQFAFFQELNKACINLYSKDIDSLISENKHKDIVSALLNKEGLNYGNLPKGVLLFHKYDKKNRTPFEEHIYEGIEYSKNSNGKLIFHFTISAEHTSYFAELKNEIKNLFGDKEDIDISFSTQKESTDTIAVDKENKPFIENGEPLFRPGGHGALLQNLNDIDADIVFIKNIDNVVPDNMKEDTIKYKKIIGGVLIDFQEKVFRYIEEISAEKYLSEDKIKEIEAFLNIKFSDEVYKKRDKELILEKLNRPIRVCGMVKNTGEAGGGPFFAYNKDNSVSLQILESSQINLDDERSKEMFYNGTHFNPVDIVCAVKNHKNNKFDLRNHIDKETGFISKKSKNGKELKALELPGLWNGSMSDWNTIFVEVPLSTFNPVKNVNDLLRKEHQ